MKKDQLRNYFQWFMDAIPRRIQELACLVNKTPGLESWKADNTPDSLDGLGIWFATQVETRRRTEEEIKALQHVMLFPISIAKDALTNQTYSLAMDIGMYFSQVLIQAHPFLRWEHALDDKKFADYGHPVLVRFRFGPLNPIRIAVVLACGIANGKRSGKRLRELFDIWSQAVETQV